MQKKKCKLLSKYISVCVFCLQTRMNVGVAHSEVNPNTRVMNSRGIWLTYALGVGILHIVLLSIPFFSVPVVWTLTNVIHNFVSYISHCLFCRCCSPPPEQTCKLGRQIIIRLSSHQPPNTHLLVELSVASWLAWACKDLLYFWGARPSGSLTRGPLW